MGAKFVKGMKDFIHGVEDTVSTVVHVVKEVGSFVEEGAKVAETLNGPDTPLPQDVLLRISLGWQRMQTAANHFGIAVPPGITLPQTSGDMATFIKLITPVKTAVDLQVNEGTAWLKDMTIKYPDPTGQAAYDVTKMSTADAQRSADYDTLLEQMNFDAKQDPTIHGPAAAADSAPSCLAVPTIQPYSPPITEAAVNDAKQHTITAPHGLHPDAAPRASAPQTAKNHRPCAGSVLSANGHHHLSVTTSFEYPSMEFEDPSSGLVQCYRPASLLESETVGSDTFVPPCVRIKAPVVIRDANGAEIAVGAAGNYTLYGVLGDPSMPQESAMGDCFTDYGSTTSTGTAPDQITAHCDEHCAAASADVAAPGATPAVLADKVFRSRAYQGLWSYTGILGPMHAKQRLSLPPSTERVQAGAVDYGVETIDAGCQLIGSEFQFKRNSEVGDFSAQKNGTRQAYNLSRGGGLHVTPTVTTSPSADGSWKMMVAGAVTDAPGLMYTFGTRDESAEVARNDQWGTRIVVLDRNMTTGDVLVLGDMTKDEIPKSILSTSSVILEVTVKCFLPMQTALYNDAAGNWLTCGLGVWLCDDVNGTEYYKDLSGEVNAIAETLGLLSPSNDKNVANEAFMNQREIEAQTTFRVKVGVWSVKCVTYKDATEEFETMDDSTTSTKNTHYMRKVNNTEGKNGIRMGNDGPGHEVDVKIITQARAGQTHVANKMAVITDFQGDTIMADMAKGLDLFRIPHLDLKGPAGARASFNDATPSGFMGRARSAIATTLAQNPPEYFEAAFENLALITGDKSWLYMTDVNPASHLCPASVVSQIGAIQATETTPGWAHALCKYVKWATANSPGDEAPRTKAVPLGTPFDMELAEELHNLRYYFGPTFNLWSLTSKIGFGATSADMQGAMTTDAVSKMKTSDYLISELRFTKYFSFLKTIASCTSELAVASSDVAQTVSDQVAPTGAPSAPGPSAQDIVGTQTYRV